MTNITSLRSLKILLTLTLVVSACACDPPRLTRGSVKTALKQYEGKSTSMFFPDSDWCLFSFSEGKKRS